MTIALVSLVIKSSVRKKAAIYELSCFSPGSPGAQVWLCIKVTLFAPIELSSLM